MNIIPNITQDEDTNAMFSYETDGKLQGLIVAREGTFDYNLSAYSVEKNEFTKQLMKRRFTGYAITFLLITVPIILVVLGMFEMVICLGVVVGFILLVGGLDGIISLFNKDELLFKYSTGYKAGYAYGLHNTDPNKIYQKTYSRIFAENGNTMFWFKIFNMKNKNFLREATEIMLSEKKLRDFSEKVKDHRNYISTCNKAIVNLEQMMDDDLIMLEESFNSFKNEVMETEIEHDLSIDEIMEMAVKVRS